MKLPALALAALLLAGCSATPTASPPVTGPSAAATPSPSVATENQVASIIAGYEPDARDVIDGATECRLLSVIGKGVTDETKLMTCYTNELTLAMSSETTAKDLRALTIPDSMTSLVDETLKKLDAIVAVDLESACGPAMEIPKDSEECTKALGTLSVLYASLDGTLDKWSPYL